MRLIRLFLLSMVSGAPVLLLSGCGSGYNGDTAAPIVAPSGQQGTTPVEGLVHGGQQPLANARIYVFAASTTGNGGNGVPASASNASTSLLKSTTSAVTGYPIVLDSSTDIATGDYGVTTDASGGFKIPDVACTTGTQIYLFSLGGNPGTVNNPAAGLLAALGTCTATTISSSLGTNTRIVVNEASTVAAAVSLAGFATDAVHIGAYSSTNATLAATGLANAFANSNQLESLTYGSTTARSVTPNGNGTVPQTLLNSIANSLASCVNLSSGACTTLAADATSTGTSAGTSPTETATAAIYIAQHPQANVPALFTLASSNVDPFYPFLATVPNDFSVSITFTGGGMAENYDSLPHGVAIDAAGNVWVPNSFGSVLSKFSPLGVPVSSAGYKVGGGTTNNPSYPNGVALDISGNAWTVNSGTNNLSKVTPAGVVTSYKTGLSLEYPLDIAFDASGNIWVVNEETTGTNANPSVEKISAAATSVLGSNVAEAEAPFAVALQTGSAGYAYVADEFNDYIWYYTAADAATATSYGTLTNEGNAVAVDGSNRAWVGEYYQYLALYSGPGGTVTETSPGSSSQYSSPYIDAVAIDGSGSAWVTDNENGDIAEMNSSNTILLSGTYGFLATGNTAAKAKRGTNTVEPNSIAIDGSGDVWYTTSSDSTLRELIGIATPVTTPIVYGVVNSSLGQRP